MSADGPVDVSNWSFYGIFDDKTEHRPTPFLIGPIVGAVTEDVARILVEMEDTTEVTMEAFMDGRKVYSNTERVRGRTPTVFKITGLAPGRRVRVSVSVGEFGQEREARFNTTSDKKQWKFGAVSCNCHTLVEKLQLWDRLQRVAGDCDAILHLGDQIYADEDLAARQGQSMRFDSAWRRSLAIIDPLPPPQWESKKEELLEAYRTTYRRTWNFPAVACTLASTANYMICDDHEVVDDLGDEQEHTDPTSKEFFVIRVAYQAYCEYQRQLVRDTVVTDDSVKPYYAFKVSPKVAIFMTDNRVERSLHRKEGSADDWHNRDFLGPSQWDRMTKAFNSDFADCETVLFGAPTPLVFISQAATGIAVKVIDDARGTWGHTQFKEEQKALCGLLSGWQNAKPNRAVVTLAGDVHIGGFTDSWHDGHEVPLHQMTASAIGNVPEANIDKVKEMLMRGVMNADTRMFKFKVKHHEWIFGPNYGMVDVSLNGSKRPDIALTLIGTEGVPHVRNLHLGNNDIEVKSEDHSAASKSAHSVAKIMAIDPKGDEKPNKGGDGGCCACTVS